MSGGMAGQRVLVVGGTSGIGLATAELARHDGASVAIAARDVGRLESAQRRIGGDTEIFQVDVSNVTEVQKLFDSTGPLDHVVSLAGSSTVARIADEDIDVLKRPMEDRFWTSVLLCKYALPVLSSQGSITLPSGVVAAYPRAGRSMSAASTAALEAFVRTMALELAPLRVNAVRPGLIDTPRTKIAAGDMPLEDFHAAQAKLTPVGRIGRPHDVASAILFLMSNHYMSGATITVDGGRVIY